MLKARRFAEIFPAAGCPGGARLHPGFESYFFFDFLAFLAFFAFFAFLAIASSFELMDGNATRGMLGGGPTSHNLSASPYREYPCGCPWGYRLDIYQTAGLTPAG